MVPPSTRLTGYSAFTFYQLIYIVIDQIDCFYISQAAFFRFSNFIYNSNCTVIALIPLFIPL